MKKKLAFFGAMLGATAGAAALLIANSTSQAADHLDAPGASTNGLADIADVFTWMSGNNVNLVMTVSPKDDGSKHFGPSVQYVFHVTSTPGYGMAGTETKVICTFADDTHAQCWVGTTGYIAGDPSNAAGITSTDNKIRLFAGRRSDPFFFNLQGFKDAVGAVDGAIASLNGANHDPRDLAGISDAAGCPTNIDGALGNGTTQHLRDLLSTPQTGADPCTAQGSDGDCFVTFNTKAIVLQVDKSLLNAPGSTPGTTNTLLSVWASTHTTP